MSYCLNLLRGVAIGLANIIPGVSGGTMALILGIYERLIRAIHNIGPQTVRAVFQGKAAFTAELKRIDAIFLATLGLGALAAIVSVAKLMVYLLREQHDPTYGFFFGLVLISVVFPYKMIKQKTLGVWVSCLIAIGLVVALANSLSGERMVESAKRKAALKEAAAMAIQDQHATAAERSDTGETASGGASLVTPSGATLIIFFLAGTVAISAMILPGISGSFILLLMGVYFDILIAINELRQFKEGWIGYGLLLGVFALGCVIGLLAFTRLLNFLLERYHDTTIAFLLGLVIGSLYAIWPFKDYAMVSGKRVDLGVTLPDMIGANEVHTLIAALVGAAIVAAFVVMERRFANMAKA